MFKSSIAIIIKLLKKKGHDIALQANQNKTHKPSNPKTITYV